MWEGGRCFTARQEGGLVAQRARVLFACVRASGGEAGGGARARAHTHNKKKGSSSSQLWPVMLTTKSLNFQPCSLIDRTEARVVVALSFALASLCFCAVRARLCGFFLRLADDALKL